MVPPNSSIEFYEHLKNVLPKSTGDDRDLLARIIIDQNYDLKDLSKLLFEKNEVATRFLWLLSDVGRIKPKYLWKALPYLFSLTDRIKHLDIPASFANYWLLVGVPTKNEAQAISLLFKWLYSNKTKVNTKSRSLFVLLNLSQKYPELKNELKLCIEDQIDKNTIDFSKRAHKVLLQL